MFPSMCARTNPTRSRPVTATANLAPTLEFRVVRSQREIGGVAVADGSAALGDMLGSLRAQISSTGIPSRIAPRGKGGGSARGLLLHGRPRPIYGTSAEYL